MEIRTQRSAQCNGFRNAEQMVAALIFVHWLITSDCPVKYDLGIEMFEKLGINI